MSLDDLIGLLFLLFFVVLPALQGLLRKGPLPPLPEEADLPPSPKPLPLKPVRQAEATPEETGPPAEISSERAPPKTPPPPRAPEEPPPPPRRWTLPLDREGILKGMVWHEILKRPKGW